MGEFSLGVVGATGRLGTAITQLCAAREIPIVLTASFGGWQATGTPSVLIDASAPQANRCVVQYCREQRIPLVQCVSNLLPEQLRELEVLAELVPVVRAVNLSLAHHVQQRVIREVAALLGETVGDVEASVFERHPVTKAHRPSATARRLADTWTAVSGEQIWDVCSRRAGLAVSDHEIQWTWAAETLVLRHSVGDLAAAASGAVIAAEWVHGRAAGLACMREIYDDYLAERRTR
ncbi:dihydrodipicolinate reductase C-terminal domain-containing protein [Allokutzneria albata]|uniref:4-hydroxy-tetrahydrodipicolinate reductase n=1 Tax=Allokutzneria albata TaxID=211114 RepID=A0A1G9RIZ2_ALLAB|nr:dihydrodipicolinate reductase C-terminal domain-containing protein [Allokutzneria albata]SDM23131.1 dihydrodipicolinate reductase [Allokutzneria albata]